uniref:Uncharacterized protein n=1 Tax=Parascaris univalens TaxID=6257 RepID=A0A914ZS59_PARUN
MDYIISFFFPFRYNRLQVDEDKRDRSLFLWCCNCYCWKPAVRIFPKGVVLFKGGEVSGEGFRGGAMKPKRPLLFHPPGEPFLYILLGLTFYCELIGQSCHETFLYDFQSLNSFFFFRISTIFSIFTHYASDVSSVSFHFYFRFQIVDRTDVDTSEYLLHLFVRGKLQIFADSIELHSQRFCICRQCVEQLVTLFVQPRFRLLLHA